MFFVPPLGLFEQIAGLTVTLSGAHRFDSCQLL